MGLSGASAETRSPRKSLSEIHTTFEASCEVALSTPEAPGNMPYLGTVIREHQRIFVPSVGGTARVVPPEGAQIYIDFIPGARMAPWPFARVITTSQISSDPAIASSSYWTQMARSSRLKRERYTNISHTGLKPELARNQCSFRTLLGRAYD